MSTVILRPNGVGDLTQLSGQFPAPGDHWDKTAEVIPDEDATYAYHGPISAVRDSYALENLPFGISIITNVRVYLRARRAFGVAGEGKGATYLRINGSGYEGPVVDLLLAYTDYYRDWANNPGTGVAWTPADINALQAGVYFQNFNFTGGAQPRATQVYIVVTYIALPTVSTNPATAITSVSATLNGLLDDDGGQACQCGFEWGLTPAYGNTTPTQNRTTGQTFAQPISGLAHNMTYHFRAFAINATGTSYGVDTVFDTLTTVPAVQSLPATGVT